MDHQNTHNDCRDGNRDSSSVAHTLVDMADPRHALTGHSRYGGGESQSHCDTLTFSNPYGHGGGHHDSHHGHGHHEGHHDSHHGHGHHDGHHGRGHGHGDHLGPGGHGDHGDRGHSRNHDSFDLGHLNLDRLSLDELIQLGNAVANQLEHDLAHAGGGQGGSSGADTGSHNQPGDGGTATDGHTPGTDLPPTSGTDTPPTSGDGVGSGSGVGGGSDLPPTSGSGTGTDVPPTSGTGTDNTNPPTGSTPPGGDTPAPPATDTPPVADTPLPPVSGGGSDNPTPPPSTGGGGDNPIPTGTDTPQPTNVGTDATGRYTDAVIQMLRATDPRLADTLVGAHGLMSTAGFAQFESLVAAKYTADSVDGTLPTYGALLVSASRELHGDDQTQAQKAIQQELSLHGDGAVSTYVPDMQVLDLMTTDPTLAEAIRNAQVSAGLGQMSDAGAALFEEEIVALVAEDAYYHTFPKDDSLLAAASALQAPGNDALYANVASQNAISTKGNQYVSTYA